jgi:hypothetical protein
MRTKWEIAAAGIGTVAAALAIAGFAIRYLSEDRWAGKLRPLDNRSEDVQFLLTDWCDRLGDVLTFRKARGERWSVAFAPRRSRFMAALPSIRDSRPST